ncbi:metalloprotease [Metarhizium brunneum]
MRLIPSLVANILALSIAVLPGTAESTSVEPFCDWETTSKHSTIQNDPLRRTDSANREGQDLGALWEDIIGPVNPDDSRVLHVGVYMHVVGRPKADASSEFLVTREALTKQVDVLNKSFKPANIFFTPSNMDWTNGSLYLQGRAIKSELAKDLYRGNLSTLNILFVQSGDTRGGSTIVDWAPKEDGCIVNAATVPGGSHPVWNMGITAVHEVGHWFSLGHTEFTKPGDCEHNWRNVTGLSNKRCGERCDWNYMSYGADECLLEFTPEQIAKMRKFAIEVRGL